VDQTQARTCQCGTPGRRAVSGMPGRQEPPVYARLLDTGPFLLCARFILIACAFAYDAHSAEFDRLGRVPVLKARMNPD